MKQSILSFGMIWAFGTSIGFAAELNPVSELQRLYDEGRVSFLAPADELTYVKALAAIKKQLDGAADTLTEEVSATQSAMMSYLVGNGIFGFKIADQPVSINIVGSARVVARIKDVIISAGVTGRVRPIERNEREFNRLRGHLISLLPQLKQKDPNSAVLESTTQWACNTKVASRNTNTFGEEIIDRATCRTLQ